jgi:hypothetical protein
MVQREVPEKMQDALEATMVREELWTAVKQETHNESPGDIYGVLFSILGNFQK